MSRELAVGSGDLVLRDRGRVLAREAFDVEEGSLQAALQRLLPQRSSAPISARVAVSHARLLLLPWFDQLTRPERWNSLAVSCFEQTFGEPPDGWALRVADDLPPRARLAAALPETLLHSLRTIAKVRSVRIGLLDALGLLLKREPDYSGCVAQIEPHRASLLMMWRGDLTRVRTRRFDAIQHLAAVARSEWISTPGGDSDRAARKVSVAVLGDSHGAAASLAGALGCSRVLELS